MTVVSIGHLHSLISGSLVSFMNHKMSELVLLDEQQKNVGNLLVIFKHHSNAFILMNKLNIVNANLK